MVRDSVCAKRVRSLFQLLILYLRFTTAYYLDYQEKRNAYVKGFFDKLVNWSFAEESLELAIGKK